MLCIVLSLIGLFLFIGGMGPDHGPDVVASWWLIAAGLATLAVAAYQFLINCEERRWGL